MNQCALIIGHKKTSPGAVNEVSGLTEYDFNDRLSIEIQDATEDVSVQRVYRRKTTCN